MNIEEIKQYHIELLENVTMEQKFYLYLNDKKTEGTFIFVDSKIIAQITRGSYKFTASSEHKDDLQSTKMDVISKIVGLCMSLTIEEMSEMPLKNFEYIPRLFGELYFELRDCGKLKYYHIDDPFDISNFCSIVEDDSVSIYYIGTVYERSEGKKLVYKIERFLPDDYRIKVEEKNE